MSKGIGGEWNCFLCRSFDAYASSDARRELRARILDREQVIGLSFAESARVPGNFSWMTTQFQRTAVYFVDQTITVRSGIYWIKYSVIYTILEKCWAVGRNRNFVIKC